MKTTYILLGYILLNILCVIHGLVTDTSWVINAIGTIVALVWFVMETTKKKS